MEMNYWLVEVINLSEMYQFLFEMVKELLVIGREMVWIMYGCNGWVVYYNIDIWCVIGLVDKVFYGIWFMGGVWLIIYLWQYYLYSGDKLFFFEVYLVLKGVVDFYFDYLIEYFEYGWMVIVLFMFLEYGFLGEDIKKVLMIVLGCMMDNQIIFDVFSNVLYVLRILKMFVFY